MIANATNLQLVPPGADGYPTSNFDVRIHGIQSIGP